MFSCVDTLCLSAVSDLIRMDRIKMRQQKFKRGKEKMLSMVQESGEGPALVQPEDDDDGMATAASVSLRSPFVEIIWFK